MSGRRSFLACFTVSCTLLTLGIVPASAFADEPPTVLITGSSRGIGLEITRRYAEKGWRVIATCRTPEKASALREIAAKHSNVSIEQLDVTDFSQIDALAAKYADTPIDVLLNNAGFPVAARHSNSANSTIRFTTKSWRLTCSGRSKCPKRLLTMSPPVNRKRSSISPAGRAP